MTDVFVVGLSAEAVVTFSDLRITIYEVFGIVEEFGPGYVLGFPKLSRFPLRSYPVVGLGV